MAMSMMRQGALWEEKHRESEKGGGEKITIFTLVPQMEFPVILYHDYLLFARCRRLRVVLIAAGVGSALDRRCSAHSLQQIVLLPLRCMAHPATARYVS